MDLKRIVCVALAALLFPFVHTNAEMTSAKAAVLINGDTGEIIYSYNENEKLPMASTTKIMTALILCENADLSEEITVTADMLKVEGSSMGLLAGDRVTYHDLLYGMMLASGNDAANVTAVSIAGSVEKFAEMMNRRAEELGLKNTHFVTPSGLDADGHYTTAYDLALLAAFALKNEDFAKAASSKSAVLNYGNPPYRRTLTNHNKLLSSFEGAIGVKTGFTKKSGRCLVSAAERDGKTAVAVTLNDPDDWDDHAELLEYGLEQIKQTRYSPPTSCYNVPVIGSADEYIEIFIEPYTVNTLETADISCTVRLPHFVYAPVAEGDVIGSAEYRMNEEVIGSVPLTAQRNISAYTVKPDFLTVFAENIKHILKSI